ncbi:3-deoxy-D-arabinoheptulosonate-7-phosphate synthase [Acinetobacter marinus]|uniref:Phospho-2-dehydro-3-deoxyheptonate aldolase n=1 Tax=Acinetobacter marinus TaxID=281375 RepID=A0A1G6GN41_9GAMM|nr:3-deoxy-7-phosphoheptulonate synthase [Acinetobacter marinus]SDB83358.1 3-deoxy-D-arabinoheptulosonate-7-phosphate synthase [Acinetobacter marinus]
MSNLNAQINTQLSNTDSKATSQSTVLPSPYALKQKYALSQIVQQHIAQHRQEIKSILNGDDPRLLVIVGPCSIHEPQAVLEYAQRLKTLADQHQNILKIVMRTYLEKPRSTVGWKGYVYDPSLKGQSSLTEGLQLSRELLVQIAEMNLPMATEVLNPMLSHYFDDLYSWGAIGARTSESQIHREIASNLPYALGFKNGTDGNVDIALDAIQSASNPHQFLGLNNQGQSSLIESTGNDSLQVILRGSQYGTNYDLASVQAVQQRMQKRNMHGAIIIDCSHGNSQKNPDLQPQVLNTIAEQLAESQIRGVMIESHLQHGKQSIDAKVLQYGCSVTDGCIGWAETESALADLAKHVANCQNPKAQMIDQARQEPIQTQTLECV